MTETRARRPAARPAFVALDRDGTVIHERHYLSDPAGVELLPGAVEGLKAMIALELPLVIVSNQAGIGRGYFSEAELTAVNARMCELLAAHDIRFAGLYHCPHHPDDGCACRKPAPGMLLRAAEELGLDPAGALLIGDKASDIGAGRAVGARTVLVRTGYGATEEPAGADLVADDLRAAAAYLEELLAP